MTDLGPCKRCGHAAYSHNDGGSEHLAPCSVWGTIVCTCVGYLGLVR